MTIQTMFTDDINRKINGVIQVDQMDETTEREVSEYVITKELKRHFITFFNNYGDAFAEPTNDIGVWISGFFGSGKSHFLKMLSYILENKMINGVKTVERFRAKFQNDAATYMLVDNATKGKTETILFNIDVESSVNKDKTAVLRVFAKMFYNHLDYYGENLKVAMLERHIDRMGKTDEFRRVFEATMGKPWTDMRRAFAFTGKALVPTLMSVLDMSEEDAKAWFKDKTSVEFSIDTLISDIKEYVNAQPHDFRLLFMIDEVGQYVGTETDMLLNLQSIVEKLGSECAGKVWVVCTGQEAIDEIIKVRMDAFSRIRARFKTHLSLSSSAVDEVIQKRILDKTPEAAACLTDVYARYDSTLRNLFSFSDSILDIKGFSGASEFAVDFPFVPYQFILLQKAFAEIRKHGNAGKHHSGAERSMLSGFQETAQAVQHRDEYTLVPFYRFYDTVHSFLDGSIRRVIERCENAASGGLGIKPQDVSVLKLLYMIRYVDDVKASIDNIAILMADDLRVDTLALKESIRQTLDRLLSQNYIGRSGDVYNFLTDEEQDIQKEIKATNVDTAAIVERLAHILYGDLYTAKKFRYGKYDFAFDQMVDGIVVGAATGGMKLRFLTIATDAVEKAPLRLMAQSAGQAIVVLAETPYYESLQSAMKIRKYVKQRNVAQLPKSMQDIIRGQQDEATKLEESVVSELRAAIAGASFYVDGEHIEIKTGDAKSRIDQALEYLVAHVYSCLDLITKNAETDADIVAILMGAGQLSAPPALAPNRGAAAAMEEYLGMQRVKNLPTSMADIQSRYQAIPYGWREIDVAAVMALLIYEQKVTVRYAGATVQPDNPKLTDMLRKKSEIGKTAVSQRVSPTMQSMKAVRELLREYFDMMDIPHDEDGLVALIADLFTRQRAHYADMALKYEGHRYPDKPLVTAAMELMDDILSQRKDNIALIDRVLKREDALFDQKERMAGIEGFFKSQAALFDDAARMTRDLANELDYLAKEQDANAALNQIRLITSVADAKTVYTRVPELSALMARVREGHNRLLAAKCEELLELVRQCMAAIHTAPESDHSKRMIQTADTFYDQKKQRIAELQSLALLDGLIPQMITYKDETVETMERLAQPPAIAPKPQPPVVADPPKPKLIKTFNRQTLFPAKQLETEADIDAYISKIRDQLKLLLRNCDGIKLN